MNLIKGIINFFTCGTISEIDKGKNKINKQLDELDKMLDEARIETDQIIKEAMRLDALITANLK